MMKFLMLLGLLAMVSARQAMPVHDARLVNEINSRSDVHWRAGFNPRFNGMSLTDAKVLCGTILHAGVKLQKQKLYSEAELKAVPDTYDPRVTLSAQCPSVAEIRDQSNCGSCWAFGAVEAMTDRICIQTKQQVHLSATDMLSCCDSCGDGCEGGFPGSAWDYWVSEGVVTGSNFGDKNPLCFPYPLEPCDHHVNGTLKPCPDIVDTPACVKTCKNGKKWSTDKHFGSDSYEVSSDEQQIKAELYNKGPVEAAFSVYSDFLTYRSGVYHHVSGESLGGHAVKLLGYGQENGQKYWIVANSWNVEWGRAGYFYIARGQDECGIESELVAGTPKN
eukprot:TRINITY_DN205_c0_g1_i1.p1 TRINITY_DN205_c0_g1~~TRINITY_DN205_c0_g1_i1.p1  ORF type:complete len:333 (+),score=55.99 TRINITY_DN205_c0_g1_i1:32-1030(+)